MHTLETKLLSRPGVNCQLDRLLAYPLTVLCAPLGYGKTTALRAYLHEKGPKAVCLSLVGDGGAPERCWDMLATQVQKLDADLGTRLAQLGFPADGPRRAKLIDLLCQRTYTEPTLVVVDDYHLIDCRQTADLIAQLATKRVPNLHILLLTCRVVVLPVVDLEQRGLCLMLGQEMLQLRGEELRSYFALMGCATSENTLQQVSRLTGGWISAVYLMLRGLSYDLHLLGGGEMNDLLEQNLYYTYSAEMRVFLQRLSLLDCFTTGQVADVFECPDADAKLLALAQGNAFFCYDEALDAYVMGGLLRAFLQEKAQQAGVETAPIFRRVGEWLLARGESVAAYDYLYRAGDMETILADLNQTSAKVECFTLLPDINRSCEIISEEMACRYPLAILRHICVKARSACPTVRAELEQRLRSMEQHFTTDEHLTEAGRTQVLGEIHSAWVILSFPNAEEQVRHGVQAAEYLSGRPAAIAPDAAAITCGAPHLLYCYYNKAGALRAQTEFISTHFRLLAGVGEGCESLALAEYALETGDFDHVTLHANEAICQAHGNHRLPIEICATFALSRLSLLQGRFEEGERLLITLAAEVDPLNDSALNTTMALSLAYINSCFARVDAIPAWLRENSMGTGSLALCGVAFPYIVCMRAVLLSGAFIRLEVMCQEFREKFARYNNHLGLIHNYICSAVARERLYGIEAGCGELEQALVMAAPDDVVLPFGENALGILPMLRKVRCSKKVPQAFLARVTTCCECYHRGVSGLIPTAVTLTEREQEILRMLARSMKHEEVAVALSISVPTVRYHVKNAYQKLEVNNKVSAIQKARALNLI